MPGRKSNISTVSNGPEEVVDVTPAKANKEKDGLSVEDLSLPKSMIARLAKGVLPANTQIHKDALLALHKSATVFVSYIASNSNDNAQASGKKTISPQDVIAALKDAELENFLPRLEAELKKYNDTQCDKRNSYRRKVKEEKAAAAATTVKDDSSELIQNGDSMADLNGDTDVQIKVADDDAERPMKKVKRGNGTAAVPDEDDESDENNEDSGDEAGEDEDEDDEEDAAEDDEQEDEEEAHDETMEDPLEEIETQSSPRDEALDDSDSD